MNNISKKYHNRNGDIMYYVNIFFIFSLLGHVIENIVYTKVDSGILYGIWTPIYGVGVLTIIFLYNKINSLRIKQLYKVLLLFVSSAITLACIETLGGYYIEIVYGRIFWTYPTHHFPIGKYTSLDMMFLWGLSAVGFIHLCLPYIKDLIKKIPTFIPCTLIILFLFDLYYTYTHIGRFSAFFMVFIKEFFLRIL